MRDRRSVLVVDDEVRNRALLRAYLEDHYRVLEAQDGASALSLIERESVDLVLLDVMMPGQSGMDVCRVIKEQPRQVLLPVLLLTALGDQAHRNEGLGAHADDYLVKPVDRRELLLRVAAFLRLRAQEQTIVRQVEALRDLGALKDDLVSLLVHDLRNPLTGLMGLLQVLAQTSNDPEQREDLHASLSAADRMRLLLEDLLQVRQLEEGRLVPHAELLALEPTCRETMATVGGLARDRGVTLEVDVPTGLEARFDRALILRALENLVINAVRYTHRATSVLVAAQRVEGGVELSVADRGDGIPEASRDKLFAKFGALGGQSSGARRGFGLGLYLVRLVATAHGGNASVHERDGGGTVFRIVLPD